MDFSRFAIHDRDTATKVGRNDNIAQTLLLLKQGKHRRIVVELGMGDGLLLEALANRDGETLHIGIEINDDSFKMASSRIYHDNVLLLHGSFEVLINDFDDLSIDKFLIILPDPAYIDRKRELTWRKLYQTLKSKLKTTGHIELVTEMTNELLEPVMDDEYFEWIDWLKTTFTSLGFQIIKEDCKAPPAYSSRCLEQFRGDPERIRMVTLLLARQQ